MKTVCCRQRRGSAIGIEAESPKRAGGSEAGLAADSPGRKALPKLFRNKSFGNLYCFTLKYKVLVDRLYDIWTNT